MPTKLRTTLQVNYRVRLLLLRYISPGMRCQCMVLHAQGLNSARYPTIGLSCPVEITGASQLR
eukprot:scaffold405021_cov22-Prasinocladus_malaysianus.AAC.1